MNIKQMFPIQIKKNPKQPQLVTNKNNRTLKTDYQIISIVVELLSLKDNAPFHVMKTKTVWPTLVFLPDLAGKEAGNISWSLMWLYTPTGVLVREHTAIAVKRTLKPPDT